MPKRCECILYAEDGWDEIKIKEVIATKQSILKFAMILHDKDLDEDGNLKKPHYHLYLSFGNTNCQFEYIAKWFDLEPNKVQRIRSRGEFYILNYYLHRDEPLKYQYGIEEIIANFDVQQVLDRRTKKENLDNILRACAEGVITRQNYERHIDPVMFARHEKKIQGAWKFNDHVRMAETAGRRDCQVIWVYGESSVGKSTLCSLYAKEAKMSLYITATGNDPFSNYEQQDIVVLDDLRPHKPFEFVELLKVLDPNYYSPVQSRYHNKVLCCSMIFVTTILSPENFVYQSNLAAMKESAVQLYRRVTEIWHVRRDSIEISEYIPEVNDFEEIGRIENPVPLYLKKLEKEGKSQGLSSAMVLNAITKELKKEAYETDGGEVG